MIYKKWNGFCLCGEEDLFPADAVSVENPFAPLVFLVNRDPVKCRGIFAVAGLEEVYETEGIHCLLPCQPVLPGELSAMVAEHGATVLNTSFHNAFSQLMAQRQKKDGIRVTLVGLGDVGRTVLTGLVLLGGSVIREIAVYDPDPELCARCEMELNQVLPLDGTPRPVVTVCAEENIFHCDLLAFTASRGVPGLDSGATDVRMAQLEANREMIRPYARRAREEGYRGLFCQISDPVDQLARAVFLESNRDENGQLDFGGLLPEQIQGFGLGVMSARAAFFARKENIPFEEGRVYGPHGEGLLVVNSRGDDYDEAISEKLTLLTREANLRVRELGFKPYIAPGLSSAAVSLVRMLQGEDYYGSIPMDGIYFGCRGRRKGQGLAPVREELNPAVLEKMAETFRHLQEYDTL